jgi:hypothetical protein
MNVLDVFSDALVDEMADALEVSVRPRAPKPWVSKPAQLSMLVVPENCSHSLFISRAVARCFFFEFWSTCPRLDTSVRSSMKAISSDSFILWDVFFL